MTSRSFEIRSSLELVSDRFPYNFKYEAQDYIPIPDSKGNFNIALQATQIGIWDGMKRSDKVDFIPRKEQQTKELRWRPKLIMH